MSFVDVYSQIATLLFGRTHYAVAWAVASQGCSDAYFCIETLCLLTGLSRDFVGAAVDDLVHFGLATQPTRTLVGRPHIPEALFAALDGPTRFGKPWSRDMCEPHNKPRVISRRTKRSRSRFKKRWVPQ